MLTAIQQCLREHGRLSLRELALHFSITPAALEPMLDRLVQKGRIRRIDAGCDTPCAGCTAACREDMLLYELVSCLTKHADADAKLPDVAIRHDIHTFPA